MRVGDGDGKEQQLHNVTGAGTWRLFHCGFEPPGPRRRSSVYLPVSVALFEP